MVAAALDEIRERGWAATSMQRVRERAGVSNGSLFHHFPTRAHLEAAVLGQALADHQATMRDILMRSRTAHSGVRNVVRGHVDWIAANPNLAVLLLSSSAGVLREQVDETTRAENTRFFEEIDSWLRAHGWTGRPELFVLTSIWLGPVNELARNTLSLGEEVPSGSVVDVLADAAWHALAPHLGEEEP